MAFTATPSPTTPSPCVDPTQPIPQPPLTVVPCDGQNVLSAPVSTLYRKPLLNRMRAVQVHGGQQAVIRWQMHDKNGNPVDLSECVADNPPPAVPAIPCRQSTGGLLLEGPMTTPGSTGSSDVSLGSECRAPYALKLRVREDLSLGHDDLNLARFEVPAYIYDAANGIIQAVLTAQQTASPGVYFAEAALVGEDTEGRDYLLFANTFYLYVDRSMWSRRGPMGPPSLAEVRLHLRDSEGAENFLLDNLKFDAAEIAFASANCVAYWNEVPPDIARYNTQNFPFRYHWLQGICAQLFMMVAEQFRANNLQYSAAGVSVNDQDKMEVYEKAAVARNQEWKDFVRRKKAEMNLEACYGEVGSPYGMYGYGRHIDGNVIGR